MFVTIDLKTIIVLGLVALLLVAGAGVFGYQWASGIVRKMRGKRPVKP